MVPLIGDTMTTPNNFDAEKQIEHFPLLTPTSRFVDLITAHRPRASILNARLVYSWLAYRSRLDLPASIRSIHRDVGLHAGTIRQALADLSQLVEREGNDWYSVQPPADFFHSRRAEHQITHWTDRLAYSLIFLPRKGASLKYPETTVRFGLNHAIVWSHLFRECKKKGRVQRFTIGGTAALYGLADNTVRSVLKDLTWLKLITRIDRGGCSEITTHALTPDHQKLFRLKLPETDTVITRVERKPRPYTSRNDGWDHSRQVCHGLMQQTVADELVAAAKELGETPNDFKSEISRLRQLYESKKVSDGKFGAYARAAYANRVSEKRTIAERQAEEDRIATIMRNTDFIALRDRRQKAAAHDPLHKDFCYEETAVFARVDFGDRPFQKLDRVETALHRHITSHVKKDKTLLIQQEVDLKTSLCFRVRKQALAAINEFYMQETKATPEQFEEALDEALVAYGVATLFEPKKVAASS
jgi:hypothetical protein